MPLLLITYDLRVEKKRPDIVKAIRERYPSNCKVCESSYVVETDDTPDRAHERLSNMFDDNDWRGIFRVGGDWQGRINSPDAAWLNQHLYP